MRQNDCILVSIDFSHGEDKTVLVVGRKAPNQSAVIINAFQGEEAVELYNKLITKKEVSKDDRLDSSADNQKNDAR